MDRHKQTRQVLLDLVTSLNKEGGLDNESIAKLHFDSACDKIESIYEGRPETIVQLNVDVPAPLNHS